MDQVHNGEMKRLAVVAAWLAGTVLSGAVAWAVVGHAGERVGDEAVAPLSVKEVEDLAAALSTTSVPSTGTTGPPTGTSVSDGAATTTASATTDTTLGQSSSTTTSSSPWEPGPVTEAHRVAGGLVVIRYTPTWVELVGATPDQGFGVEVKSAGPEKVVVEFDGDEEEIRFEAELSEGEVVIRVMEGD